MKNLINKTIVGIFCFLISANTNAANWYQVEMIIFEHLYPETGGEQWYNNKGLPDIANSVELVTDQSGDLVAYQVLPTGRYKIRGVYSALKSSREYRPVMHIAWQQPGLTRSNAKYVHIRDTAGTQNTGGFQDSLVKIDGTVRLRGGHFLFLDIDLAYFFNSLPESTIDSVMINENITNNMSDYARLTESRKVKLNELHYFDHPLFGVITWVRRLSKQ